MSVLSEIPTDCSISLRFPPDHHKSFTFIEHLLPCTVHGQPSVVLQMSDIYFSYSHFVNEETET